VLAGNAGAGFTHNFPRAPGGGYAFPPWIKYGAQDVNGYVRVTADAGGMLVEAVGTDDGAVFDSVRIGAPPPSRAGGSGGKAAQTPQQQPQPQQQQQQQAQRQAANQGGMLSWLSSFFGRPNH
jgi:hypothetical protein